MQDNFYDESADGIGILDVHETNPLVLYVKHIIDQVLASWVNVPIDLGQMGGIEKVSHYRLTFVCGQAGTRTQDLTDVNRAL
jgi:imidazole glycerol phosphate synthase subunit HisF